MNTFTLERIYIASVDQSNAINATKDKRCKAADMAGFYADCIICDAIARRDGIARIDWHAVNYAILERWPKGLVRIKTAAWKLFEVATKRA